ncbi:MAG: tripartite tricarboxylate transporter permease [Hyphomicrobiales bacterium]|nr:tripartite tricarboxylate transporter permease [Hyphomicrobiales bacterium]
MIETFFSNLNMGLETFLHWHNVLAVFVGVATGIFIGSIPGMTATMAVALLVPLTFTLEPVTALALLIGVYKGGIYGGSIAAILINTPGTPAAAATALDGFQLAQQGKGKKALKMAIYASVLADILSDIVLILVAAPLAAAALQLGPPERATLLLLAMTIVGAVSGHSLLKGLMAAFLGLLFATVGTDFMTGTIRFSFGSGELAKGIGLIPLLIGLFAIPELLVQIERKVKGRRSVIVTTSADPADNRVSWAEFRASLRTILRSTGIGTFIGAIPGIGSVVAAFISYGMAKRASKTPEAYGRGSLDGVAAAESGNNAVCGATLIPLLTLGIPGDSVTAVMLGAFLIQGLVPGPSLITDHPGTVYGLFVALMFGNVANFIVANLGIRVFTVVARTSMSLVFPVVAVLCAVGSYAIDNSFLDVKVMLFFGAVGYFMRKFDFPIPPLLIAFVLGPMMESAMKQSLIMSQGSPEIFVSRPVSLAFVLATVIVVAAMVRRHLRVRSETA